MVQSMQGDVNWPEAQTVCMHGSVGDWDIALPCRLTITSGLCLVSMREQAN